MSSEDVIDCLERTMSLIDTIKDAACGNPLDYDSILYASIVELMRAGHDKELMLTILNERFREDIANG